MKKIKVFVGSLIGALSFVPALAFAQTLPLTNLGTLLSAFQRLMNMVVPILIGLAVIAFLWGVLLFVFRAGDPDARKTGQSFMLWAVIGIVVMVSVWGLVYFVQATFGLGNAPAQQGPDLPMPR